MSFIVHILFFSSNFFFYCSVSLGEDTESSLGAKVTKLVVASVEESCLEGGAETGPLQVCLCKTSELIS